MDEAIIQTRPDRVFAFIDRTNLDRTTKDLLNFSIDWKKLAKHLREARPEGRSWLCEKVFIYTGARHWDVVGLTSKLTRQGYEPRVRESYPQKDKLRETAYKCEGCSFEGAVQFTLSGAVKSNCDVDLTVDAMACMEDATEILLFSGDGDFEALVRYAMGKGKLVRIVSNTRRDKNGEKKFSTRFTKLLAEEIESGQKRASFIDINDWKKSIELTVNTP